MQICNLQWAKKNGTVLVIPCDRHVILSKYLYLPDFFRLIDIICKLYFFEQSLWKHKFTPQNVCAKVQVFHVGKTEPNL